MLIKTNRRKTPQASGELFDIGHDERQMLVLPFGIVRDRHRESTGWRFTGIVGTSEDTRKLKPKSKEPPLLVVPVREEYMPTGDYKIDLPIDEPNCYIERKAADDLLGSLAAGHLRLRGEMERMRQLIAAGSECHLIAESSLASALWDCDFGGRRLSSETILTVVATWPRLYNVSIHFAGDRAAGERLALRIFRTWWENRELERIQQDATA